MRTLTTYILGVACALTITGCAFASEGKPYEGKKEITHTTEEFVVQVKEIQSLDEGRELALVSSPGVGKSYPAVAPKGSVKVGDWVKVCLAIKSEITYHRNEGAKDFYKDYLRVCKMEVIGKAAPEEIPTKPSGKNLPSIAYTWSR